MLLYIINVSKKKLRFSECLCMLSFFFTLQMNAFRRVDFHISCLCTPDAAHRIRATPEIRKLYFDAGLKYYSAVLSKYNTHNTRARTHLRVWD